MKPFKILAIVVVIYIGIVAAFESLIGYFQPADASTLVITTFDRDGSAHERVVSKLESNGQVYVAANHWPRAWFERAMEKPEVQATIDGRKRDFLAVPVTGEEHVRVDSDNSLPFVFRVLTGFPPRYFVRLDPR